MTSQSLFNALCDPVIAHLFLKFLSAQDLIIFLPLVAQANKKIYDWLFMRTMFKEFYPKISAIKKAQVTAVKIPSGFNKIYTRTPLNNMIFYNALIWSYIAGINYRAYCNKMGSFSEISSYSGSLMYMFNTNWVIICAETMPVIKEKFINRTLRCGFNVAIDPNIKIINNSISSDLLNLKTRTLFPRKYRVDETVTSFFRIPNLIVYTTTNPATHCDRRAFIFLHSSAASDIHRAVDAVNKKILMLRMDYSLRVHAVLPSSKRIEFIPFVFYGESMKLPREIRYVNDGSIFNRDKPLFRELPIFT